MTAVEDNQEIVEETAKNTHNVVGALLFEEQGIRSVLDLPCGEGAFTKRLLDRELEVQAGDCVNIIKVPDARFQACDMNRPLPYKDGEFDAVVCIDGIEHIERPFDFVRECHRIVRDHGILIVSTPNISALRSRWRWFLTGFHNKRKCPLNEGKQSPLHHINMLSFPDLRYLLHVNGFKISSIRTNRVKAISWVYAILLPIAYLVSTSIFYREEKDPAQRRRNKQIFRQMFSKAVLFGESLVVKAERI